MNYITQLCKHYFVVCKEKKVGFRGVGSVNTNIMMSGLYFAEVCWSLWGLKYCQESIWVK